MPVRSKARFSLFHFMLLLYLFPGTMNRFMQKHFSKVQKAKLLMIIGFFLQRLEQAVMGTQCFPVSSHKCSCGTCETELCASDCVYLRRLNNTHLIASLPRTGQDKPPPNISSCPIPVRYDSDLIVLIREIKYKSNCNRSR